MGAVIVGIDPGTTSAYAILDTDGNLLALDSSRLNDISGMIKQVIQHGNPVIVGCDKNPAPGFVQDFATKTGAKLVVPKQDLLVKEKKELVDVNTRNDHEMDAYASARYAYNQYKTLLQKIDKSLEQVKHKVIKEELSIDQAVKSLEEEEPEEMEKVKVQVVRPEKEIREMEKEITLLEEKNKELRKELSDLKKENEKLKRRIKGMPVKKVVRQKEANLKNLSARLERSEHKNKRLNERVFELKKLLVQNSGKVLLKKFKNLSQKEYEDRKWMKVKEGDILLVEDPNIVSDRVLEEIRGVEAIVHRKRAKLKKDFIYIPAKDLELDEKGDFAFATKESLEKALSKKDVLKRVVMQYRLNKP